MRGIHLRSLSSFDVRLSRPGPVKDTQPNPPPGERARPASARYDGLDMVRAAAMLLGITAHAAVAYAPDMGRWYFVEEVSTDAGLEALQWLLHSFRMQVFFVLSGLFAHLVMDKRGPDAFLADRFRRLVWPLLVGLPLVVLYDKGLRTWSQAQGTLSPLYAGGAEWLFRPLHLWFLGYLFLYVAGAWLLARVGLRAGWLTRAFGQVLRWPELFLALAALTFASVHWLGEPNPAMRLTPELASLVYYLPFFVFGWLVWSHLERAKPLLRAAWLVAPGLALGFFVASRHLQFQASGQALNALVAWLMVLGSLGLALRVRHAPRPVLRATVEASYWVYLVHHPLVVAAQIALATLPWNAWLKYAAVVIAVAALSLASAPWVLRRTFLGGWLGARRAPG